MIERRTGGRALETISARREREAREYATRNAPATRRAFWQAKAAESDRAREIEREADARAVLQWRARFDSARAAMAGEIERKADGAGEWLARFHAARGTVQA